MLAVTPRCHSNSWITVSYLEGILPAKRGGKIKLPWATHPCLHCSHWRWFVFPGLKLWQLQFRVQPIACKGEHRYAQHVSDVWDRHHFYKTKPPLGNIHWAMCARSVPGQGADTGPRKEVWLTRHLETVNTLHGYSTCENGLRTPERFIRKDYGLEGNILLVMKDTERVKSHIFTKSLNWPE